MSKHLFLSDLRLLEHGISTHPENADRLQAILDAFEICPHKKNLDLSVKRFATLCELKEVHDRNYVKKVFSMRGKEGSLDYETLLTKGSVDAALLAAGLGLELVERLIDDKIKNGFALVRPPGHHACPSMGMGFCLFNNIAIAAKKALAKGVKRLLILDWDVHHGNGTQEVFYEDNRVLFIDLHQENLFPVHSGLINETGMGKGAGFTVNIPLPTGCQDEDYLYTFDKLVKPLALNYQPELILVSAGFDAHESDPLGFMNLTTTGFGCLAERVQLLANDLCGGKVLFFLEGGYNPFFLAKNVMECIDVLENENIFSKQKEETIVPVEPIKRLIKEIHAIHFK